MSVAVRRALYGKLAGDSTLTNMLGQPPSGQSQNIYHSEAPSGASYPMVIFFQSASTPVYGLGDLALEEELWSVKGVDRNGSADPVDNIADRLDALLTDGTISISGSTEKYLRRESGFEFGEVVDGVRYKTSGAIYRLIHEPT